MNGKQITTQQLTTFARHLRQAERSPGTIENYLRHVRALCRMAWRSSGDQGGGGRLERAPA